MIDGTPRSRRTRGGCPLEDLREFLLFRSISEYMTPTTNTTAHQSFAIPLVSDSGVMGTEPVVKRCRLLAT